MTDWVVVSSLATAGGTLLLATATFTSTRSANRAAERGRRQDRQPMLVAARSQDPTQKVRYREGRWFRVDGGHGVAQVNDADAIHLAISVRNVGRGVAVLHAWDVVERDPGEMNEHRDPALFRQLSRDLYIAPEDCGFWQGRCGTGPTRFSTRSQP